MFLRQLDRLPAPDYVIAHHAEPDHSGCLPDVLRKFPAAQLLCTPKAQGMLCDLLPGADPMPQCSRTPGSAGRRSGAQEGRDRRSRLQQPNCGAETL